MKGISESGALNIVREVGGLYTPLTTPLWRNCELYPGTPEGYLSTDLSVCGLSDVVLGDLDDVTITWYLDVIQHASDSGAIMWHTHPIKASYRHSPPSVLDNEVSLNSAFEGTTTDQFVVTSAGLWRLYCSTQDVEKMSAEQGDSIGDELVRITNTAMSIMSDDALRKFNEESGMHVEKMTVPEYVQLINDNNSIFTVEYHHF